jgi:hypothetical protein
MYLSEENGKVSSKLPVSRVFLLVSSLKKSNTHENNCKRRLLSGVSLHFSRGESDIKGLKTSNCIRSMLKIGWIWCDCDVRSLNFFTGSKILFFYHTYDGFGPWQDYAWAFSTTPGASCRGLPFIVFIILTWKYSDPLFYIQVTISFTGVWRFRFNVVSQMLRSFGADATWHFCRKQCQLSTSLVDLSWSEYEDLLLPTWHARKYLLDKAHFWTSETRNYTLA